MSSYGEWHPVEMGESQRSPAIAQASQEDHLLDELNDLAPRFELQSLVDSANQSLRLLAPLFESAASVDDPRIHTIRSGLEFQILQYRRAMGDSVTAAQDGYNFAMEGVHLCEYFDQGRSPAELTSFIDKMRELARGAREKSESTSDKFRSIRTGVTEISKLIPDSYIAIHDENGDVNASSEAPNAAGNILERHETKVPQSVSETISRLLRQINFVEKSVSDHSAWWIETDTRLVSIRSKVRGLDAQPPSKERLATIYKGWKEVRSRYFDYKIRVAGLRDLSLTSEAPVPVPISRPSTQVEPEPEQNSSPETDTLPGGSSMRPPLYHFKRTLLMLAEKTESATKPFHNTQTAAINLHRDFPLEKFTADGWRLRDFSLRLKLFLEKCYGYAQYFVSFPSLLETGTIRECSMAVHSISSRARRLVRDAKGLARDYNAQTKKFLKHWDEFRRQLVTNGHAQRAQSLDGFPNALHQIRAHLGGLVTFWEDESRLCATENTTISELKRHATQWETYQSSIESAIVSISTSSDYILGPAVATDAPTTVEGTTKTSIGYSHWIFSGVLYLVRIRGVKR